MIGTASYDPKTVAVLQAAFDELCKEFQCRSSEFERCARALQRL